MKKKPEEMECIFTWYEQAVEESVWGIQDGYLVENTFKEMMKRHATDGHINRNKQAIRLAKVVQQHFLKIEEEYISALKKIVMKLEQSVTIDADTIRRNTTFYPLDIDYSDIINPIEDVKCEIRKTKIFIEEIQIFIEKFS